MQCSQASGIERRRYLDEVSANEPHAAKPTQQSDSLAHRQSTGLGCAGARGKYGIECIDVERQVGRLFTDDAPSLA